MSRRRWWLVAAGGFGVALLGHGVVARFARCPVRAPTFDELETQRMTAMRSLADASAASAPSLAVDVLVLGTTTRAELVARLGARGPCVEELGGASVTCAGPHSETVARFDRAGRLVGLDESQERASADEASRELRARLTTVARLGPPSRRWGEPTPQFLDAPLRQAGATWRFRDLAVDLTATHLAGGVIVRAQHRLLEPGRG